MECPYRIYHYKQYFSDKSSCMQLLEKYSKSLEIRLSAAIKKEEPSSLYEPIRYILSLGGKRLRPVLTLMCCDFFGEDQLKAMNAALAVELFHNFSLIHDDIMDNAPLRRGQETVHEKWDLNTGILSGDAMLILAYQLFEAYEPKLFVSLAELFSKTAIEVCEGQQYDVDFENRDDVSIAEYLKMIEYKTAVLMGAAMKMGAVVANAPEADADRIYEFGKNLGIAFQLQDDYLDAFGNPDSFGKQLGGDIISNKKTFLYLQALNSGAKEDAYKLRELYGTQSENPSEKIIIARQIFINSGSVEATKKAINTYTDTANSVLNDIQLPETHKQQLRDFGKWLMTRRI